MGQFKIALCQLVVTPDKKANIDHALGLIKFAVERGVALVILPVSSLFVDKMFVQMLH